MKRAFKLFFVAMILSLIVSLIRVPLIPTNAMSAKVASISMELVSLSLPADWSQGSLVDVWGSSASDVYAVGTGIVPFNLGERKVPLLYHYNGSSWAEASPSLPDNLTGAGISGVWGLDANNIYAVGYASEP